MECKINKYSSRVCEHGTKSCVIHHVIEAPTDNGIPELDSICDKFNKGELNISQLVCTIWNTALYLGGNNAQNN